MIACSNPSEQFTLFQQEIEDAVLQVMRGSQYILGNEVRQLEEEFAAYIGTRRAVGVANGTDALEIALRATNVGVNDEVITVSHTAVATIAAIEAVGATPVFVDIIEDLYTLDSEQLASVLSSRTKVVIAVHLYGQSAQISRIKAFCDSNGLILIEDVSQAHGAEFNAQKLGSIGHIGCFSCYPTKNLGAIGDAGLITTNDSVLADQMIMIREYGWVARESQIQGRNSRLDELQAAILRVKLRHLDDSNAKRNEIAAIYDRGLAAMPATLPMRQEDSTHVFHLYVIRIEERKKLMAHLRENDIYAGIHYAKPAHMQPAFTRHVKATSVLNKTEKISPSILSLPMYPELGAERAARVVDCVKLFFQQEK